MTGTLDLTRVDQVGSLLRPERLKAVLERRARNEADDAEVNQETDAAIREVVRQQEAHDLPILTDGEYRRMNFQESMSNSLGGFEVPPQAVPRTVANEDVRPLEKIEQHLEAEGVAIIHRRPVTERLRLERNVPLEEWRFVQALTPRTVKVTMVGPDRIGQRFAWENSRPVYAGQDDFMQHLVEIQRQMVLDLAAAGCRYVHVDEPGYTAYVDEPSLQQMRSRGEDPAANLERSVRANNAIIDDVPGVTFGVHLCRGNERSMWHRAGTYDAIAERVFSSLHFQRLLLEYDDERSGGFAPLRFVRKGTVAVLGLITTKTPRAETVDDLQRRVDEAAHYLPLEQLAISPQCGFASAMQGNFLSEADQWRKLDVMMEAAHRIWG